MTATRADAITPPEKLRVLVRAFTVADLILITYLLVMSACVWRGDPGTDATACAHRLYLCVAVVVVGCFASRLAGLPPRLAGVVYRATLAGVLLEDYLMLRDVLPLARPDSVDRALLALDLRLFGVEPSLWLERFNHRPIVEWFAFFYFSYFAICLTYFAVVVCLPGGKRRTLAVFSIGTLIVFCVGQLGYVAVPGFGPIRFLQDRFDGPIDGGYFWHLVTRAVDAGSAMKDIFPSLHTAAPTWFTGFAVWRARDDARWRIPAIVTGFFAANIIVSTMLLRWHYAIDVCAGLALGIGAARLAPLLARAEQGWRSRLGLGGSWSFDRHPPLPIDLGTDTATSRAAGDEDEAARVDSSPAHQRFTR